MLDTELLVGAYGWDRDEWVGGFYPEELPNDWRLGYYSNRLRAVLVPAETSGEPGIEVAEWLDDIYPEFRMVIEWNLPESEPLVQAQALVDRFADVDNNVDAYLVRISGNHHPEFAAAIQLLQAKHPVCIAVTGETDTDSAQVLLDIPGISRAWRADIEDTPTAGGGFLVTLTSETNLKKLRELVEKIDKWSQQTTSVEGAGIFFLQPATADTAVQTRSIVELMGV